MTNLIAAGTIKARFDSDTHEQVREAELLGRALDELQVSSHRVWTVEKVLGLLDKPTPVVERAARLVACAVVTAISQGSTGVPLEGGRHGTGLSSLLETLLETAHRLDESGEVLRLSADKVLDDFQSALDIGTLAPLVGAPSDYSPITIDRGALYTHQTATMEASVADKIAQMLGDVSGVIMSDAQTHIDAVLDVMPFPMDGNERLEKLDVLDRVLPRRFSVVSGGAGSGKTTIVLAILRVLQLLDGDAGGLDPSEIALAAPTGKAAKRLWESVEAQVSDVRKAHSEGPNSHLADKLVELRDGLEEPKTLHRLLGYSPYFKTFRRNADSPLSAKLVVVDEASMVDLSLMDALLDALDDDARLLLVGDAGQLPAVQAGAVFHDLSATNPAGERLQCTSVLQHNFRVQGAKGDPALDIPIVADNVRDGSSATSLTELIADGLIERSTAPDHEPGVCWIDADEQPTDALDVFVDQWWRTHYSFLTPERPHRSRTVFTQTHDGGFTEAATAKLEALFDKMKRAQLLCITRVLDSGANRLNWLLHRKYVDAHGLGDADRFEEGEPVMITRNDYDADVFNGDVGIVLYTLLPEEQADAAQRAKKRVVVPDGDGFRAVPFGRIKDKLEHAYALTVHKSQGSEYDHVGVVLPALLDVPGADDQKAVHPLMTREILYTAITRAKESVTLFGSQAVFDGGAANSAGRYSGVRDRLAEREYGKTSSLETLHADDPQLAESSEAT